MASDVVRRRLATISPIIRSILITLLAFVVLYECATFAAKGSTSGTVLAIALAISPLAIYWSLKRPLLVPFAIYAFTIPFNDLITLPQFGTLDKLLGILSGAAILFWLIRKKSLAKPAPALLVWIALGLWIAATGAWAADLKLWWPLFVTFLDLISLYLVISFVPATSSDFWAILVAVCAGGVLAAAYGIVIFHSGPGLGGRLWFSDAEGNVVNDPNHFAGALLLPIAVTTMFALRAGRFWARLLLSLSVAVMMAGIYVSGSRGALLAAIVMFVFFMWRSRHRLQLILIMAVGALASLPVYELLSSRLGNALSSGGAGRLSIWAVGLEAFKHHWLIGIGLGNFPIAYNESFISVYQQVSAGWSRAPHNLITSSGVELGIIGLALMLAAWFTQISSLKHVQDGHPLYDVRVMLEGALLALFVTSMFADTVYQKYLWLAFAVMALGRSLATTDTLQQRRPLAGRRAAPSLHGRRAFLL